MVKKRGGKGREKGCFGPITFSGFDPFFSAVLGKESFGNEQNDLPSVCPSRLIPVQLPADLPPASYDSVRRLALDGDRTKKSTN